MPSTPPIPLNPLTPLISATELQALLASNATCMVFDCSFDLATPDAGARQYAEVHIPGAVYAHLDNDLSAKPGTTTADDPPASGGRHPLPSRARFAAWLSRVGFGNHMQAVVYDRNGANFCGRLWWMLLWAGHGQVAVLDGGLQAWQAAGGTLQSGDAPAPTPTQFALHAPRTRLITAVEVLAQLGRPTQTIVDARARPRYRGEVEPLDPVAGHIPGALNRPFNDNLDAQGRFKPAAQLRSEFDQLLAGRNPASVVHQCGSGVSALPNLLAMEVAGLHGAGLFAGSWSEWCSDPSRPVATGEMA